MNLKKRQKYIVKSDKNISLKAQKNATKNFTSTTCLSQNILTKKKSEIKWQIDKKDNGHVCLEGHKIDFVNKLIFFSFLILKCKPHF